MRLALPPRRPCLTRAVSWQGHAFTITIGIHEGAPVEVFADTDKGGQMQAVLADACVIVSLALQHGIAPAALAKSLAREPDLVAGEGAMVAASPIGSIVDALVAEVTG